MKYQSRSLRRWAATWDGTDWPRFRTGEGIENQAFLKTALKKLRRANKRLHRPKVGSKTREKARRQVAGLHERISCLREEVLQKLSTRLANSYGNIGVEDLHLKGLFKNRRLARSFCDAALGKLRTLLTQKVEQRGGQVIKLDRFFPSRKTGHCCGWKGETMTLKDRILVCKNPHCPYYQFAQDRDHHAGENVLREALRLIGLRDQAVCGTGSDEDAKAGFRRGVRPTGFGLEAPTDEAATTKFAVDVCLHPFAYANRSSYAVFSFVALLHRTYAEVIQHTPLILPGSFPDAAERA